MNHIITPENDQVEVEEIPLIQLPDRCWNPIRTKARGEKKLAEWCQACQIPFYLPLNPIAKKYPGRLTPITHFVPMFTGYIFCQLDGQNALDIVQNKMFVRRLNIVSSISENQLIEELKAVRAFENLAKERQVIVKPEIVTGVPVIVDDGKSLRGIPAIVTHRDGKTTVTVNIEMLGMSVSTQIDVCMLEISN